jgi:signal peptidase II
MAAPGASLARPLPATIIVLVLTMLDQWIKYLVETRLPFEEMVPLIPHLALFRTWNEGVAFSFLSGMSGWAIVLMRILIVAFILWWWRGTKGAGGLINFGFIMIIAGAIGNIVDRFLYGHVVDYVLFHTETWSFAVFNLADSLITVGAVIVGLSELFLPQKGTDTRN